MNVIQVSNVLLSVSKITSLFYPDSLIDNFDPDVKIINEKKYPGIKIGKNVLLGKNVYIGKDCSIGHNTIIESNVRIGNNCISQRSSIDSIITPNLYIVTNNN